MNKWFEKAGAGCELVSITRFLDSHVYVTLSGAYGISFQLHGIDAECLSSEELASVSRTVMQAQRLLSDDISLYQILIKRRRTEIPHSKYEESPVASVASTQRKRHEHLQSRGLGSVSLFCTIAINRPKSNGPQSAADYTATSEWMFRKLSSARTALKEHLADLVGLERLDEHGVAQLYSYIANWDEDVTCKRLSSRNHVGQQLARVNVRWLEGDYLQMGRRYARIFSMTQRPSSTSPNMFGELLRIDADLILVLESQRMSADAVRSAVNSQERFKNLFRYSVVTVLSHMKSSEKIEEGAKSLATNKSVGALGAIIDDIENTGLGYTKTSVIGLIHSDKKSELYEQMASVQRVFSRYEAVVLEEQIGLLSAHCSMFPAAASGGRPTNVRRFWLREDHLANMSLIYAPYAGEAACEALEETEPLMFLETRDRTLFAYNPYSDAGVRGKLIVGATGRGKSFLLNQEVDMQAKYDKGYIFIFDIGGSYEETVLHHGGSIVRFGLDGPRLNPFDLPDTKANCDFVFRLVRLMLVKGGAVLGPSDEVDLHERVRGMFTQSPRVRRLSNLVIGPHLQPYLSRWIGDGIYGKIFDNLNDELRISRITAFDFQRVANEQYSDLMEPLLFWLRWQTQAITQDPGNLGIPKLEVYDELWKHLEDPSLLAMILNTASTARKYLGGIILATQDANQLGEHWRIIKNACSDVQFLGGPFDKRSYAEMFDLHERQLELIASLQIKESLLVRTGRYSKVVITSVDPEATWRYTTRAKDRKRRQDAIEEFGREKAFAQLTAVNH